MQSSYPIDFRSPQKAQDLPAYIGIDADLFEKVISSSSRSEFYLRHQISKRSRHRVGKVRVVWDAQRLGYSQLADAHKAFSRRFEIFARSADARFPHEAAYGYVRHRGTRDNASVHCGAQMLLRADIKDFFPSISKKRLVERFLELGMKNEPAVALAKFATIDDYLPLGLNASPMLANLVCVDLDEKVQQLALTCGSRYTRYADDISISSNAELPARVELEKILSEERFRLNEEKFRITKNGQAHYVTGLSISDKNCPHAPRRMKRQLRQELYFCNKFGIEDHLSRIQSEEETIKAGVNRLDGTVHYVSHNEPRISNRLRVEWRELLERDDLEPSFDTISHRPVRKVSCFIDECELAFGDKKYLALALVFTEDIAAIEASTVATLREHRIKDPFYAGDKEVLDKKGLHFTDSHPDLRTAYVKVLSGLPCRAFIIFGELRGNGEYKQTYLSLLSKLLRNRLIWYDKALISLVFEENSHVSETAIRTAVGGVYCSLEKLNARRPNVMPSVKVSKKRDQLCFSVPDYLLAIFARFAKFNEKPDEKIRQHQFERLRDKYRLILDADTGVEYSRRQPFSPWLVTS